MSSEDKSQESQQEEFVTPVDEDAESILEGVLDEAQSEPGEEAVQKEQEAEQPFSESADAGEDWKSKALALEAELGSLKDAAIRAQAEAQIGRASCRERV